MKRLTPGINNSMSSGGGGLLSTGRLYSPSPINSGSNVGGGGGGGPFSTTKVIYPTSRLLHHNSACNSSPNNVATIVTTSTSSSSTAKDYDEGDDDNITMFYASHLSVNIMKKQTIPIKTSNQKQQQEEGVGDGDGDVGTTHGLRRSSSIRKEHVWSTVETLRTATQGMYLRQKETQNTTAKIRNVNTVTAERVITCIKHLKHVYRFNTQDNNNNSNSNSNPMSTSSSTTTLNNALDNNVEYDIIVVGFSDGSLTSWIQTTMMTDTNTMLPQVQQSGTSIGNGSSTRSRRTSSRWKEHVLIPPGAGGSAAGGDIGKFRSITDVDGYVSLVIQPHDPNDLDNDDEYIMMCSTKSLLSKFPPAILQNRGISLHNLCFDCPLSKTLLQFQLVVCNSGGAFSFETTIDVSPTPFGSASTANFPLPTSSEDESNAQRQFQKIISTPTNVVKYRPFLIDGNKNKNKYGFGSGGIFLVGTSTPKHNKIHVLTTAARKTQDSKQQQKVSHPSMMMMFSQPVHVGSLVGHEDWITCFDWFTTPSSSTTETKSTTLHIDTPAAEGREMEKSAADSISYLASGSQDGKIRMWKWVTATATAATTTTTLDDTSRNIGMDETTDKEDNNMIGDDDDDDDDDEEQIEGEARLEFTYVDTKQQQQQQTSVYLEALLIGHEDKVTSVAWHPCPHRTYNRDLLLVSASMDRTIFLWCEHEESGIWTPITRVGSAGGILGGSIGSSLLGFLNVQVDPIHGSWIMGAAYGGALHFFSCDRTRQPIDDTDINALSIEERAAFVQWRAQPCVTGHFAEINDLCWEASRGMYLLTAGNDQTCRLWAPLAAERSTSDHTWVEIARPQVHGYNLAAVTSLSTKSHKHLLVTGGDEKEIRVFDGTLSFIRQLGLLSIGIDHQAYAQDEDENVASNRVERAYVPALGLSNKASASDGAEEDTGGASTSLSILPLERDLGSTSLWPEIRKLYGHTTEIARLTSTLESRTALYMNFDYESYNDIIVASSAKARDVESASIRLWNVDRTRCLQNLKGGHRSTVTAMCFSPDGQYLATSGKDRRLCLWSRGGQQNLNRNDDDAVFSLASAIDVSHKRIVWTISFCPFDPAILASGSRDGTVKLWKIQKNTANETDNGHGLTLVEYAKFVPKPDRSSSGSGGGKAEAITSLVFAPIRLSDQKEKGLLAIGFENGLLQLWKVPLGPVEETTQDCIAPETPVSAPPKPTLYLPFRAQICHLGAVNKMAWRPVSDRSSKRITLATCSEDHGCRIFEVQVAPDSNGRDSRV